MKRLLLVRHAPTGATRDAEFPADEPLDDEARAQAAELTTQLPRDCLTLSSPARRAVQTALAAGREATTDPRLAECDFGTWTGRRLEDLHRESPQATEQWMTDPGCSPHGGESLRSFMARVGAWLDEELTLDRSVIAFTHGGVIRAAVAHALRADAAAVWRIRVEPLGVTELQATHGDWELVALNRGAR
ncbi:histidine phosphatase family protein [Conexibacter sp. S30A1]|jgi:broad specificity phosphatase PhoE|uniref:histidine phosphatase family protein n=1 Tax=Conexibacter sp. S30A1 TaxID=2937800 RepID=UPI00200E361D|nr:histidine phosphatase family protein [Conexibacter sp. S30A1]